MAKMCKFHIVSKTVSINQHFDHVIVHVGSLIYKSLILTSDRSHKYNLSHISNNLVFDTRFELQALRQ